VLFLFTALYTSWRMFSAYSAKMQVEEERMLGPRPGGTAPDEKARS
jgi:hypothetical protein